MNRDARTPAAAPHAPDKRNPTVGRLSVAVLFGGFSSEHSISALSAASVVRALQEGAHTITVYGLSRHGQWVHYEPQEVAQWVLGMDPLPVVREAGECVPLTGFTALLREMDVVFPVFHGPFGEDGSIQGLLELAQVRYVGAGVLASAVAMDKVYTKRLLAQAGLVVGAYTVVSDAQWGQGRENVLDRCESLSWPMFVKPARGGSSIGISCARDREQLAAAIERAGREDPKVVVEAAIEGREIECAVLQGAPGEQPRVAPPGEVVTDESHNLYDFDAKYVAVADATLRVPAPLPENVVNRLQAQARLAFTTLGVEGLARVDFFYTPSGELVVNEVNTMPGFTAISMYPRLWEHGGVPYPALVNELLQLALRRPLGLR